MNPALRSTYGAIQGAMAQTAPSNVASNRAWGIIEGTLNAQSAAFSYVDVFRYLALACFLCGLVVFLMKKVRTRAGAASMAH